MASSNRIQIEKIAGRENYITWKLAVKSYLELEDLWECVDPGTEVDSKKDLNAKSKIILLVDPLNYVHIENANSSREVWKNLQNAFEDSGLSKKDGLLRDLINTSLDNCESVEVYVNKIMSTAYQLRNIGFTVHDKWLGTLMLAGLPDNYKPMIMGLESSGQKISSDFVKTKFLQEVKDSEFTALFTKHKKTVTDEKIMDPGQEKDIDLNEDGVRLMEQPESQEHNEPSTSRDLQTATLSTPAMSDTEQNIEPEVLDIILGEDPTV